MNSAPFFAEIANGPTQVSAHWLTAADEVRIRIAVWPEGTKGTVLIFPGRSEYVEKYAPAAADLNARGYAVVAIDWRGQGLADRLLANPLIGHVGRFGDYQLDVKAVLEGLDALNLPKPHYLLAHSMGGAIGLRALIEGLDVKAAVFSAPMWGILIKPVLKPLAVTISTVASRLGLGGKLVPGTGTKTYVSTASFEDNLLTTDAEMFAQLRHQIDAHPELSLAGPSLQWLYEALKETQALASIPSPDIPTLTAIGNNERIIDTASVHDRMGRWAGGVLTTFKQAEHEIMMERPATRRRFFDQAAALFGTNT